MKTQTPLKRLILRAVLRKVSPMVIRVLAVPDYLDLSSLDEVLRAVLGWDSLGFSFHIHGEEFTSFRWRTRAQRKALRDFQLRPAETFLYTCAGSAKSRATHTTLHVVAALPRFDRIAGADLQAKRTSRARSKFDSDRRGRC